jgi:hypothetical protein
MKMMIRPTLDVSKWMYNIHNCINNKLRKQGLNPSVNPKYYEVKQMYSKLLKTPWEQQLLSYWDFLFAVAYNHPKNTPSTPMLKCPNINQIEMDLCERNKWNILSQQERLEWLKSFWLVLPEVLPSEIRQKWKEQEEKIGLEDERFTSRKTMLAWLWKMRCGLDRGFKDPYTTICKRIATFSSDCGKKQRGITCRKRRKQRSKTLKR